MERDKEQVTGGPGQEVQLRSEWKVSTWGLRVETSLDECGLEGK